MRSLSRRTLIAGAASTTAVLGAPGLIGRAAGLKTISLAEPVHLFAYIPLYLANDAGFYAKHGVDVKFVSATGGAHVAALASGQVWGNVGGAESDAMANNGRSDPLFAIVNIVNRALIYFSARKGLAPKSSSAADMKEFFRGKKCAFSRYGGTPDVLARTYIESIGLDPKTDITIINNANISDAPTLVKTGAADVAVSTEPQIAFGIEQGIWDEPIYAFSSIGDYAFACVSVRKSTITGDAATAQAFVAAVIEALKLIQTNRGAVESSLKKQFPTLSESLMKRSLDRCYKDKLFSTDGVLSPAGYDKDMESVYKSGEMTRKVPWADAVDMTFVNAVNKRK